MIFKTNIIIPWNIEYVFDALNEPLMMQKIASPLVIFKAVKPSVFPYRWQNGGKYRMNMYFFGVLPLGWQELSIESIRSDAGAVFTDIGPGFVVKQWNHKVILSNDGDLYTRYDETLELTVGLMAPLIWLGMTVLFAWRKYRWLTITKLDPKTLKLQID
jgi:hypothetical protein